MLGSYQLYFFSLFSVYWNAQNKKIPIWRTVIGLSWQGNRFMLYCSRRCAMLSLWYCIDLSCLSCIGHGGTSFSSSNIIHILHLQSLNIWLLLLFSSSNGTLTKQENAFSLQDQWTQGAQTAHSTGEKTLLYRTFQYSPKIRTIDNCTWRIFLSVQWTIVLLCEDLITLQCHVM